MTDLIDKAREVFKEDPLENSRRERVVWARMAIYALMRDAGVSLNKVAETFKKDRATVMHALKTHKDYIKNDKEYIDLFNQLIGNDFIYIAGAITNEPEYAALFEAAEKKLRRDGLIPVNPVALNHAHDKTWLSYMREDLAALVRCSKVYALSNWQTSKGAMIEVNLAISLGIEVIYEASSM